MTGDSLTLKEDIKGQTLINKYKPLLWRVSSHTHHNNPLAALHCQCIIIDIPNNDSDILKNANFCSACSILKTQSSRQGIWERFPSQTYKTCYLQCILELICFLCEESSGKVKYTCPRSGAQRGRNRTKILACWLHGKLLFQYSTSSKL